MTNKSKKILSEISAGELLDKISILEIKMDKIKNNDSISEINKEYRILKQVKDSQIEPSEKLEKLYIEIKKINSNLISLQLKLENNKRKNEKEKYIEIENIKLVNNNVKINIIISVSDTIFFMFKL